MSARATDLFFWLGIGVLFVLVIGGGVAIMWARRNAKAPESGPQQPFTLDDLRRMLDRGEISKREFDTARDAMIQRTRQVAERERERRGGTDWGGSGNARR